MGYDKAALRGNDLEIDMVACIGQECGNQDLRSDTEQEQPRLLVDKVTVIDHGYIHDAQKEVGSQIGGHDAKGHGIDDGFALFFANGEAAVDLSGQQIHKAIGKQCDGRCSAQADQMGILDRKQGNEYADVDQEIE